MIKTTSLFATLSAVFVFANTALGDQISIVDCTGEVRFIQQATRGVPNTLTLSFDQKIESEGTTRTALTNLADNRVLTALAAERDLSYKDVSPGEWRFCDGNEHSMAAANISFKESGRDRQTVTSPALVGAGLLAAVAGGVEFSRGGSTSSGPSEAARPLTLTGSSESVNVPAPSGAPASARKTGGSASAKSNGACFVGNDDNVNPLSPFS